MQPVRVSLPVMPSSHRHLRCSLPAPWAHNVLYTCFCVHEALHPYLTLCSQVTHPSHPPALSHATPMPSASPRSCPRRWTFSQGLLGQQEPRPSHPPSNPLVLVEAVVPGKVLSDDLFSLWGPFFPR